MEVTLLPREDSHSPIQYNDGSNNRLPALVPHYTTYTFMNLDRVKMEREAM